MRAPTPTIADNSCFAVSPLYDRQVEIVVLCLAIAVNRWNMYEQSGENFESDG